MAGDTTPAIDPNSTEWEPLERTSVASDDAGEEETDPLATNDGHQDGREDGRVWVDYGEAEPEDADSSQAFRWWPWISFLVVALCCGYVFWVCQPNLIFRNTTATGGDLGAHVWGPAYLRDELLPSGRLTGWTPDWYGGFPAYTFYMVVPSLAILAVEHGFFQPNSPLGILGALAIAVGAVFLGRWAHRQRSSWLRAAGWAAAILIPLLTIGFPYNIAFKMVTVAGVVFFPAGVWYAMSGLSLRRPGPELAAVASVAFLMDKTIFHIYGGNIASTMAGEFAFSLSLTLSMFALGLIARGLRTGQYRVRSALLIAIAALCHVIPAIILFVGALVAFLLRPSMRSLIWAVPTGVSGFLMSLWWYLPFFGRSAFLNDMGWEKLGLSRCDTKLVTNSHQYLRALLPFADHKFKLCENSPEPTVFSDPNMLHGRFFFALALVGIVLSVVMLCRAGLWLSVMLAASAVAFVLMPQARFWNARVLPFYYLYVYLLAAVGVTLLLRALVLVVAGRWSDTPPWLGISATAVAMGALFIALGLSLRALPSFTPNVDADADPTTYDWGPFHTRYQGPVRGWAKWNFEGLEQKPGQTYTTTTKTDQVKTTDEVTGKTVTKEVTTSTVTAEMKTQDSEVFFAMIDEMRRVGREEGCGRAYWEYDKALEKFGTPMTPMLLPYYTKSCIGSMEGLYFEASSTTPFHFLVQSELSQSPSRPQRFDEHLDFGPTEDPYRPFDLDGGIQHLQMLGVKYFMAMTDPTKLAAAGDERLTLVGRSGPWDVYSVADITLVEGLENEPAVWTNVKDGIHDYARPAIDWFNDPQAWSVPLATSGPESWQRISKGESPEKKPLAKVKVSNVELTRNTISFDVDKPGVPVLIRVPYFPNWEASGAGNVYRVTPNQMVVIPTSQHVELTYPVSNLEWFAYLVSFLGFLIVLAMLWRPRARYAVLPREFFADREPDRAFFEGYEERTTIYEPVAYGAAMSDGLQETDLDQVNGATSDRPSELSPAESPAADSLQGLSPADTPSDPGPHESSISEDVSELD